MYRLNPKIWEESSMEKKLTSLSQKELKGIIESLVEIRGEKINNYREMWFNQANFKICLVIVNEKVYLGVSKRKHQEHPNSKLGNAIARLRLLRNFAITEKIYIHNYIDFFQKNYFPNLKEGL